MKYSLRSFFLLFLLLSALQLVAQPAMQVATYNLSSFTKQLSYKNIEKLNAINAQADLANPDYGVVAPGVNPSWYEQYGKRTATSRSFVAEDGAVVSGFSYSPVNYKDGSGNYVAINPLLSPSSNGWSAMHQEFPTFLHADGSTEISLSANDRMKFNFNNSFAGNNLSVNNFTVGDNGMMIHDAIAGVDKKMVFLQNKIETDYLLNKPLTGLASDLVISEEIILPVGYVMKEKSAAAISVMGINYKEIVVLNAAGEECAHFQMPVCYDSNKDKSKRAQSFCRGQYILRTEGGKNFLDIVIPAAWLNNASRIYPVTIDPIVTGPTSLWAGGTINSCYSPSFNTATINCTIPANLTITNFYVSASYYANPFTFTYESDGDMYFTSSCGRNPLNTAYYWTVQSPGGDVSGTAYLNSQDMASTEAFCYAPSCSAQSLALTMNLGRTYGGVACDANYIYYDPGTLYPFEAYIVGRSVEITGGVNNWTVSPTTLCSNVCTLNLNVNVSGGVPPYTISHPWAIADSTFGSHLANSGTSSGSASLILNIPNCPGTCGTVNNLSVPAPLIVDACGNIVSGIVAKSVTQNPTPIVTPSPTSTTVCSGSLVNIANSSCVAGSSITWTGSNGSNGSGTIVNTPINNTSSPITVNYTVYVSVNGCAGTPVIVPVTVNPVPVVAVSPLSPSVCGTQSASLTASGASTYAWSPSGGLSDSTGATTTANIPSNGTYIVTGTDASGCSSTSSVTVTVNQLPSVTVSPSSISTCGSLQPVPMSASGAATYMWSPSSGLSSTTGDSVLANPSSTATYIVTGTDGNGCSNTASATITINSSFIIDAGPDANICPTASTQINVTGAPAGSTYTWSPSTDLTCNNCSDPIAAPSGTTTYIVTATSPTGCSGADTVIVVVTPLSASAIQNSTVVCAGSTVQLDASGGTNYSWTPAHNISDAKSPNPTVIPDSTTTYTVTVTTGNCSSTATVTINTFPPLPTPTINQSFDTLTCTGNPLYTSYQWYFNSTPIVGATAPIYIASQSGNYNLAVHDANGCFTSVGINIVINVGLNNLMSDNSVSLFPNPTVNELRVKHGEMKVEKIEIYNVVGERVYSQQPETRNEKQETHIDVSSFASGVYFLQLQTQEGKWVGRFVKE